jgi:hypothetical protein
MGAEMSVQCCGNQRYGGGPEYHNQSSDSHSNNSNGTRKHSREFEKLMQKANTVKPTGRKGRTASPKPITMVLRAHDGAVVHTAQIQRSAIHDNMMAPTAAVVQRPANTGETSVGKVKGKGKGKERRREGQEKDLRTTTEMTATRAATSNTNAVVVGRQQSESAAPPSMQMSVIDMQSKVPRPADSKFEAPWLDGDGQESSSTAEPKSESEFPDAEKSVQVTSYGAHGKLEKSFSNQSTFDIGKDDSDEETFHDEYYGAYGGPGRYSLDGSEMHFGYTEDSTLDLCDIYDVHIKSLNDTHSPGASPRT